MPNGTFAIITTLIGALGTALASNGIGSTALDGALVTVALAIVSHFAQNSAPPKAAVKA
jgi:hypothetical protein